MEKRTKIQATPATPVQKAQQPTEAQCKLRDELVRRRFYLFATLAEEAGEVTQCVGKIMRFGENDFHPKTDNVPNIDLLHDELNDLFAVALELGWKPDTQAVMKKQAKVEKYWRYVKGERDGDDS